MLERLGRFSVGWVTLPLNPSCEPRRFPGGLRFFREFEQPVMIALTNALWNERMKLRNAASAESKRDPARS